MAMDKDVLGALMTTKTKAITGINVTDETALTNYHKALADAVISHIKTAALVTVASGIAVSTAGSATAQTGATTATGAGTIA